jgi:SAM-dependent methyltransferase
MPPAVNSVHQVMRRVGAATPPDDFAAALARAWRAAQSVSDEEIRKRFGMTRGYQDFCGLLRECAPPPGARVLAIGSGDRMGGRRAEYAASVVREQYDRAAVEELNWGDKGPPIIFLGGFDLVVTHSFLHYLPDFRPVCEWICGRVKPGGAYVMANEPNLRFWRNPECVQKMEEVGASESRWQRLSKLANPGSYLAKARRVLQGRASRDDFAEASRLVRERMGLRADLTVVEIVAIVEPHRGGLSWDELAAGPLFGTRLETVRTSGYVRRDNPARVPARWRELDESLASRYPLDGCSFSALWRKL